MKSPSPIRYHPLSIGMHWLMLALLIYRSI